MNTASLDRVKVALLRELEVTFQSHFHQHLSEVVTDLRVHNIEGPGLKKVDEVLSVIQSSGILQLMSGEQFVSLRSAIDRLNSGRYGLCLRCGRKIPLSQLESTPTAQFCPRCRAGSSARNAHPRRRVKHT